MITSDDISRWKRKPNRSGDDDPINRKEWVALWFELGIRRRLDEIEPDNLDADADLQDKVFAVSGTPERLQAFRWIMGRAAQFGEGDGFPTPTEQIAHLEEVWRGYLDCRFDLYALIQSAEAVIKRDFARKYLSQWRGQEGDGIDRDRYWRIILEALDKKKDIIYRPFHPADIRTGQKPAERRR